MLILSPQDILRNALGSLSQVNTHATYFDPGNEHWGNVSILNAAHVGETLLKAIISKSDPKAIFSNPKVLNCEDQGSRAASESKLRTINYSELPSKLLEVTKQELPNKELYQTVGVLRNAIQHCYHADGFEDNGAKAKALALRYIYEIVDPLLMANFEKYAIKYIEDHSVGYDYLVERLLRDGLRFNIPEDFSVTEISVREALMGAPQEYVEWFEGVLRRRGLEHMLRN